MPSFDAVVIGAGVAGLAAGWQLARAGQATLVVEREPLPCSHASGRNAAIFRHAEPLEELCRMASRSRELLDEVVGSRAWLERTGALYVAPARAPVDELERSARRAGVRCERVDGASLAARHSLLAGGDAAFGLASLDDGIIDVHGVAQALAARAREAGARLSLGAGVERVLVDDGSVAGVMLDDGERVASDVVVLAAGAWAASLGARAGAPLPLVPLRRHLALVDDDEGARRFRGPIVWRIVDEVYLRPEGSGALASPCDEEPFAPSVPPADPDALLALARKLAALAPLVAGARVRRSWACLRTFAPDRNLVVGRDPRVRGLAWLAGLGGHGMTLATAAAELLVDELVHARPAPGTLSPARMLEAGRSSSAAKEASP